MTPRNEIPELWQHGERLCNVIRLEDAERGIVQAITFPETPEESKRFLMWTTVEPEWEEPGLDSPGKEGVHTIRFPEGAVWGITLNGKPAREGEAWCTEIRMKRKTDATL